MKRKNLIIILISLIIVFCMIVLGYYYTFIKSANENRKNTKDQLYYVYKCENEVYNKKYYYSTKKNKNCVKMKFNCNNCDIEPEYIEKNKIIFRKENTINIYDLNKKKLVDTINVDNNNTLIQYYKVNNKIYGFTYQEGNSDFQKFYNLETNKTSVKLDGELCYPSDESDDYAYPCKEFDYELIENEMIYNDVAVFIKVKTDEERAMNYSELNVNYGLVNLKTGKILIKPTKTDIKRVGDYYISSKDYINNIDYSIIDKNGNYTFKQEVTDNPIKILDVSDKGYFLAFQGNNYIIIDSKGNLQKNSNMNYNSIVEEMTDIILEDSVKKNYMNKTKKGFICDNMSLFYQDNAIIVAYNYKDENYQSTTFSVKYKYFINNNKLEILNN